MKKVEVINIYLNYHTIKGETAALKNISFSLEEGEFVTIVGPSGCGKSSLLNIIASLREPSSGSILVDGKDLSRSIGKFGYMFQRDHLFEWLNVWDNIILGLKIQHKLTTLNKNRVLNLLEIYNLKDFIYHYPNELSGGMRQRVALIRTLALEPEVLLLDEPFSGLDFQTRLNVIDEISEIIKKEKKTVLMVTHDISEAISMSNRVLVFSKRPANLKEDISITFDKEYNSPLKRRDAPEFRIYFDNLWKELDKND